MAVQGSDYPFMPPSSTCVSEDLLFFDTFSHSNSDKNNFDLVQFPSPVIIDFIKIVPLGQPVEANIPGNVRLGATNPSKCELEFFINDLTKQDAHTMTDLGKFYCSEKDTDFSPPVQIQTDGLLLRGNYRTLTLAIFGQIVAYDEKPDDEQAMLMSVTSPTAQTPASPIASERDLPYIVGNVDQDLIIRTAEGEESLEESTLRSGELSRDNATFDISNDINEDNAIMDLVENENEIAKESIDLEDLSNKDNDSQNVFGLRRSDEIEYSNSSDLDTRQLNRSNVMVDQDTTLINDTISNKRSESRSRTEVTEPDNVKQAFIDDVDYDAHEWVFKAKTYKPKPLNYFPDPSLTLQEKTLEGHHGSRQLDSTDMINKEVNKVKEMFDVLDCSSDCMTEEWVTLVGDLTNDISNMSLSRIIDNEEMLHFLVEQINSGTNIELALKQRQTGFKVRHLKAGIKLATILFHCGEKSVSVMLDAGVPHQILSLYNQDQMSLPLRLLIFKCLSAICDNVAGVEHVIGHFYSWGDKELSIQNLKRKLSIKGDQIEIHSKDGFDQVSSLTCYQYMILILMSKPTTRIMMAVGNLIHKIRLYTSLSKLTTFNLIANEQALDDSNSMFENGHLEEKERLDSCTQVIQDIIQLMDDNCSRISQPLRHLPAKIQFHIRPSSSDTFLAVYKWFKHFKIIECIDSILTQARAPSNIDSELSIKLRALCLTLIQRLLDSPKGSQFMLSHGCYQATGSLLVTLSLKYEPTKFRMTGMESLPDASLCRLVSLSFAACRDKSLQLSYHFKTLSCIDKLFVFHRELLTTRSVESRSTTCDPEKVLHQLYIMSDHPYGLAAIMKHFSCIGNLDCILRFLDMPDYQKHLEFVRETSVDYVLELVGIFLRLNNNVLEIAEEYLDTLIDLSKTKEKALATRIKSLLPWLTPFDVDQPFPLITYSEETFRRLTRVIRKSIPDRTIPFAQGLNFELPPQLITTVRILRQLCIPNQVENFIESTFDIFSLQHLSSIDDQSHSTSLPFVDSLPRQQNYNQSWNLNLGGQDQSFEMDWDLHDDSLVDHVVQLNLLSKLFQPYEESVCGDLKYHYGIMQVFEQEDLRRLLNTLRELTGNYPRPSYQSAALSGQRGRIVISYIHSVIVLLHSITCHLIDARGKEFRDTSIITVILETYSLLCFVPKPPRVQIKDLLTGGDLTALQSSITIQSDNYKLAQQTKKLILSILISHTQMCLSVSESEENVISKSMWTKMLKEVIDFTLSTPVFFLHGLDVLTKILPPPLPHSSILDTLDQEQLFKNFNHRKLWSAHLHPLHQKIEFMISGFSLCCQREIRSLLCYLCNQLCDLSSNAACMVAKVIVECSIVCISALSIGSSNDSTSETVENCMVMASVKENTFAINKMLDLLANLISNQAFKTALANHLQLVFKKDEKPLNHLLNVIKSHENYRPNEPNESNVGDNANTVVNIVESAMSISRPMEVDGGKLSETSSVVPPNELTKINLIELARMTSDRFNLTSGIAKTYRLKVFLDMNARAHRVNEPNSKRFDRSTPSYNYKELMASANQKAYAAPIRGRSRPPLRPDSFRSRPQNTSRPPSIHVDDFVDIYGENSTQGASGVPGGRFWPKVPTGHFGGSISGGGRAHSKSKYMKLK